MLLDREAELGLAAAAAGRAFSGQGSFLLVSGELGIGRSALLEEIADYGARTGSMVLRAGAAWRELDFAFGVVRQLLEPTLRRAPREAAGWAADQPERIRSVLGPPALSTRRTRPAAGWDETTLAALTGLAENMAGRQPLLVVVDDLQWADTPTLCWLRHLTSRLPEMPVVVVGALREGDLSAGRRPVRQLMEHATHTLRLRRFSPHMSQIMVGRILPAVDEEFADACHQASCGNPGILTSILAEAVALGISPVGANAPLAAGLRPASLRQRLLQCLSTQSPRVRRLARALAVLGDDADPGTLGQVAGLEPPSRDDALSALTRLGLVTDPGHPGFTTPVVRDLVREDMGAAERTATHARAAELLHREGRPVGRVAEHLMAVSAPQGPWATEILRSAAADALARGAPVASARYLRCALLDSSPHGADRGRLLVELATAERSFSPAAAARHVCQAVPLLDSPVERADAMAKLAPVVLSSALLPTQDLLRQVADELGELQRPSARERDLALRLEARLRHSQAAYPPHLADSMTRLKALGPDPSMNTQGERELLALLIASATWANAVPAAEVADLAGRILLCESPRASHVHSALPLSVIALGAADCVDAVVPWLDRAWREACEGHSPVEMSLVSSELAMTAVARGRLAEARAHASRAHELAETENDGAGIVAAVSLALVAARSQDVRLAEGLLGARLQISEKSYLWAPYLWALLTLLKGQLAWQEGDARTALDRFHDAGRLMERNNWQNPVMLPWASCAALVHHHLGEQEQAAALSLRELERAQEWGAPSAVGRALTARGRVTEGKRGVRMLRDAVDVLEGSANRFELSRALLALGNRLSLDASEGRAAVRRAYDLAIECGVPSLADHAGARIREAAAADPRLRPRLTPSERKVAGLAAAGLSNQAIADRFDITSRAVEKHLTSCYRKLSISGRDVLANALRDLDG